MALRQLLRPPHRLEQREMEALVPAVLLKMAGINALVPDAELDPPDRQRREAGRPGRGRSQSSAQSTRPIHNKQNASVDTSHSSLPRASAGPPSRQRTVNHLSGPFCHLSMRIPRQSGQGFRFDVGHRSDLIPATIPK
jgi:hypothetical protein